MNENTALTGTPEKSIRFVTPQALREFVEWASEIFARYTSLKPDAGDTPEVQEETAESIQRDQAYLDAFVAACKEAQDTRQSALDTLSAAVDELRKERDALRTAQQKSLDGFAALTAERDAARAELRAARHKLGPECDVEERTVAESIEIMKKDWQMERSHVTKLIFEGADLKKERDALKAQVDNDQTVLLALRQSNRDLTAERDALITAENRRAIGLDMPASSNAEILRLHIAFDGLKERYESLRNLVAGAIIADGGEWMREEASEMHRRKAEALLKVTAERDAARAELVVLGGACDKFRAADNALRLERDAAKRELAEMSAALDAVLRERNWWRDHPYADRRRSRSSTTDGEAQA
jgi:hypothetical protein